MLMAINMMFEFVWPTAAFALTTGPSQPEVQSFEPVETTDMVNLFTGDFTYNIPLLNVPGPNGGYPINMAYHGGVSMDQEASWVGLGWNINAGAINRSVRGVPDDFNGDNVKVTQSIKDNWTLGLGVGANVEIFGGDPGVAVGLNFRYNNYKGFGYSLDAGLTFGESPSFNVGLSLDSDQGVGLNASLTATDEMKNKVDAHYSLGASFNSKSGLNVSTSRQFSKHKYTAIGVKDGDLAQLKDEDISRERFNTATNLYNKKDDKKSISGGSSSISFSSNSHSPQLSMPMNNYRLQISMGTGGTIYGAFSKARFPGFFDTQRLKNKGKTVDHSTYGYENMNDAAEYIDFGRTGSGNVMKTTPNLGMPQLTYDYYDIQGQGIGGSFRPYRNETGRVYDPKTFSITAGGSFNFDVGANKAGWGFGGTSGYNYSGKWNNNNLANDIKFSHTDDLWETEIPGYKKEEKVYYKALGDKSARPEDEMSYVGGESAIKPKIFGTGGGSNFRADLPIYILPERDDNERVGRNNLIHKLINEEVYTFHADNNDLDQNYANGFDNYLHEYEIFYYDWIGMDQTQDPDEYLNRKTKAGNDISKHNAGYKVLDESGSYYVYGLPVYNTKKVENLFSINALEDNVFADGNSGTIAAAKETNIPMPVDLGGVFKYDHQNTDEFQSKSETPAYAYSYLMTSILGADYVDVGNNGISDDDKGYWVKFDYVKYTDNYKWRAPYAGCRYSPGKPSTYEDDKGSYSYGEKEIYYLSRIETATHIVIFDMSERSDNVEAKEEINQEWSTVAMQRGTQSGLRVDKIHLYEKKEYQQLGSGAVPIKTVHFDYDYSLCDKVPNSSADEGKLTLTKIWFTYEGNNRGAASPYKFSYAENQDYSTENYDRWGNYKPEVTGVAPDLMRDYNQNLSYVHQYYQGHLDVNSAYIESEANKEQFKNQTDANASAWCLSEITLPSGGIINVDYESDDYAYVQDEQATQMTYITKVNDGTPGLDDHLYNTNAVGGGSENHFDTNPWERRVYFKLEDPIEVGPNDLTLAERIYDDYVRNIIKDEAGKRNLYFKIFCKLKGVAEDYVSGYVPLEDNLSGNSTYHYGVDPQTTNISGTDYYTQGFVTLECAKKKNGDCYEKYHPFSVLAWQHIRANAPELLSDPGDNFTDTQLANTDKKKAKKVKSLVGFIPELSQMFKGYKKHCYKKEMAQIITLNKSMIRLTTPDKVKYGGGSRVRQISLSDEWSSFESSEDSEVYGQHYDYSTSEIINGEEVKYSSGVAQYEPVIGGDEIALKYPKYFPGKIPFKSNNNLFFEYPINEAYMPAPTVGYSKVKVTSLNTHEQITKALETGTPDQGRGVLGVTEYNFYTAKDFPVFTEETEIAKKSFNVPIIIPFIANYTRKKLAAGQGYQIELNDMHGKTKSVAKYGVDKDYFVKTDPISMQVFNYRSESVMHHGKPVRKLVNLVKTMSVDEFTHNYYTENKLVGLDYEFFTDQQHTKSASLSFSGNFNVDAITVPPPVGLLPIPSWWGTLNSNKSDLRLFVTNKIIHRSGLIEEIVSKNEHYISRTVNDLYDSESGRVVLNHSRNEFNDDIYNISHAAHWEYEGMGRAYENINIEFATQITNIGGQSQNLCSGQVPAEIIDELVPGDEFIWHVPAHDNIDTRNYKATFISKNYGSGDNAVFYIPSVRFVIDKENPPTTPLTTFMKVYRSGRRNLYASDAGNVQFKVAPGVDPFASITSTTDDFSELTGQLNNIPVVKFAGVINAKAMTYRDNWESEGMNNENPYNENPYANGEQGIWRHYKSLVYTGPRKQNKNSSSGIQVSEDGVMDDVTMYNWQIIDFEKYKPLWQWSSEVTKYNKVGYELENVDRLGIYSAALYGYESNYVIAVGGNAHHSELGAEDFERFTTSSVSAIDDVPGVMDLEGNLNFYENGTSSGLSVIHQDEFNIIGGKVSSNGVGSFVVIDRPFVSASPYWNSPEIDLALIANFNQVDHDLRLISPEISSMDIVGYNGNLQTKITFNCQPKSLDIVAAGVMYLPPNVRLLGKVTVNRSILIDQEQIGSGAIEMTDEFAHTGRQSMYVKGTARFNHGRLRLIANKEYTLSFWMRQDNTDVPFYNTSGKFDIMDISTGTAVSVQTDFRTGNVIDGWQQIEFDFIPTSENSIIRTGFYGMSEAMYIDDIRIAPKTGGIMTYVYDPINFRLLATLNADNYATFYFYDEQGNLYLTKQETEEGIFTISENHGYVKPN